jgi:hypothetical protein
MTKKHKNRIAILYPSNAEIRQNATPENNRFTPLFHALAALGYRPNRRSTTMISVKRCANYTCFAKIYNNTRDDQHSLVSV